MRGWDSSTEAMAFGGGQSELPGGARFKAKHARCTLRTVRESIRSAGSDDGGDAARDVRRVGSCD